MKKNMGSTDRIIRSIIAIAILALYYFGVINGTLGIVLVVLGIVFLLTSFINFCPLYTIFGWNTAKKNKAN